jgi:hypothetical protein
VVEEAQVGVVALPLAWHPVVVVAVGPVVEAGLLPASLLLVVEVVGQEVVAARHLVWQLREEEVEGRVAGEVGVYEALKMRLPQVEVVAGLVVVAV